MSREHPSIRQLEERHIRREKPSRAAEARFARETHGTWHPDGLVPPTEPETIGSDHPNFGVRAYEHAEDMRRKWIDEIAKTDDKERIMELQKNIRSLHDDMRELAPKAIASRINQFATSDERNTYEGRLRREVQEMDDHEDKAAVLNDREVVERELHRATLDALEKRKLAPAEVIPFPSPEPKTSRSKTVEGVRRVCTQKIAGCEKNITQLNEEKHAMSWISPADWFANFRRWWRIDKDIERNAKKIEELRFQQLVDVTKINAAMKKTASTVLAAPAPHRRVQGRP